MNLEDLLIEVESQDRRDQLIEEVRRLRYVLPKYTPLEEIYDMALMIVNKREKQENTSK